MNPLRLSLLAGAACTAALSAQDPSAPPAQAPAPTTWKDLTKSGLPIKFYGFFRLDAYYNTARMDNVVIPTRVLTGTKPNDDQFDLDPRLTRFGLDITPGEVAGSTVTGKLEIDFANYPAGVSESRATPRIRLAYLDVAQDEIGFRAGQDWDVAVYVDADADPQRIEAVLAETVRRCPVTQSLLRQVPVQVRIRPA